MNILSIHEKAMDFAQEALLMQRRGHQDAAQWLHEIAFNLEKKAALEASKNNFGDELFRSILFRSAATLAADCGFWSETWMLSVQGLNEAPPPNLAKELEDLKHKASQNLNPKGSQKSITVEGIIAKVDLKIGELEVNDPAQNDSYTVLAPADRINEIVAAFWAKKVIIEGQAGQQGVIFLDNIRLAA